MSLTFLHCAPLPVLVALSLGCGAKTDDTGGDTTATPSTTAATEPTTDPTAESGADCDDRSVLCMVAPGFEDTTTGAGGTAGPGEPMCESLLSELATDAQGLCSAGFVGIGLLDISDIVGSSNQCCYVYHCADSTQVCTPLAEAGACAEEADLGDAASAPQNACNSNIGSEIDPAPKGDFCCSTFQCVCGDTGG